MNRLTNFQLKVLVECCSNYTASTASLKKGMAQTRIVRLAQAEIRRRKHLTKIINPPQVRTA